MIIKRKYLTLLYDKKMSSTYSLSAFVRHILLRFFYFPSYNNRLSSFFLPFSPSLFSSSSSFASFFDINQVHPQRVSQKSNTLFIYLSSNHFIYLSISLFPTFQPLYLSIFLFLTPPTHVIHLPIYLSLFLFFNASSSAPSRIKHTHTRTQSNS